MKLNLNKHLGKITQRVVVLTWSPVLSSFDLIRCVWCRVTDSNLSPDQARLCTSTYSYFLFPSGTWVGWCSKSATVPSRCLFGQRRTHKDQNLSKFLFLCFNPTLFTLGERLGAMAIWWRWSDDSIPWPCWQSVRPRLYSKKFQDSLSYRMFGALNVDEKKLNTQFSRKTMRRIFWA
jgi:hypothetical protein